MTNIVAKQLLCFQQINNTNHSRYGEVTTTHLLGEPIHLPAGIAEYDSLSDGQGLVQITQGVQFPLLMKYEI